MIVSQVEDPSLSQTTPGETGTVGPRWSETSLVAALVLCAVLPYVNVLPNDFLLTYDDGAQILKNPYVHSFRHIREIFSTNVWSFLGAHSVTNYFRPVMTLGFLVCFKIFGPLAYGYHLASLVLHAAIVTLLFFLTRRMTSNPNLAFGAAALFALHPVHTEAVAWISAVTELELTFFILLAFWLFVELVPSGPGRRGWRKFAMAGSYLLALLSKEQALALPFLATVYEHFYRDDRRSTSGAEKISRYGVFWAIALAYALVRMRLLGGLAPLLQRPYFGLAATALAGVALFGQYAWKLVWPAHLVFYYVFPEDIRPLVPWAIGGFGTLALSALFFRARWRRERLASFGLVWLLVTLAPVLNVRWMASNVFSERYLYLPSVGFCWLAAWSFFRLWQWCRQRAMVWRRLVVVSGVVIAALCSLRIVTRNGDWRDDLTLYRITLAASPDSYMVREALGLAYWNRGDLDAAEQEWRNVLRLAPEKASAWNYLGTVYAKKGQFPTAVRYFDRALQLDPASADAHLNLGAAYAEQGMMESAEVEFRAAVTLSPLSIPARNVLGKLYFDAGRFDEAETQFLKSLEAEPTVAALDYLGEIYRRRAELAKAERAFTAALSLNPSDSRAHFGLGAIYASSGRFSEAVREYAAGLRSDPDEPAARAALRELERRSARH